MVTDFQQPEFGCKLEGSLKLAPGETAVPELICYVNGDFLSTAAARLPVQDLAILRGYGVFDFLRTYQGRPFRLRDHLRRLERSAQAIYLTLPTSLETIEAIVYETLARNALPEANLRIVVTGGVSSDGLSPADQAGLIVLVTPVREYPTTYYSLGVKVITTAVERYLPQAKTINYIPAIMALKQAQAAQAVEALYVNRQQHILEGTTTNFFIFHGDQLLTPLEDILPGVTRDFVIELARDSGFAVVERALTLADVRQADEAFLTASNKEIMPVHHLDDLQIGPGHCGPHTQTLMTAFHQATRTQHE